MISDDQLRLLWDNSGGDNLLKGRTFQSLFDSLENKNQVFVLQDRHLRCIDEGTPGGVHMAGSGILNTNKIKDLKGKITGVYCHEGCGAARLYVEEAGLGPADPDNIAEEEAGKLAEELGVPYLGKINFEQMPRPRETHIARVLYYDGTGHFDPSQVALPSGFTITRKAISDAQYAKTEVEAAINIAKGSHGFGRRFSPSAPFYLVAVTNGTPESIKMDVLVAELQEISQKYQAVKVDQIYG